MNISCTQKLMALVFCAFAFQLSFAQKITISHPSELPQVKFAVDEINKASLHPSEISSENSSNIQPNVFFLLAENKKAIRKNGFKSPKEIQPEGFSLQVKDDKIGVIASDAAGLMYGGLELAEQIKVYGIESIKPMEQNPYMGMRGTKFNIPLDVRNPSYSDFCDAAQKNIPEMWSMDFWKDYIDHLARYRYNFISLWNEHPFPSLVKVEDYPDVALNDVLRSAGDLKEDYPLEGIGYDAPEVMDTLEVVKLMTIDEKIEFWRAVMRYGKERNVDFYFITWNIFVYGIDGKYGITDSYTNETTRDYFKKSVEAMVTTYPDLKGIGLTTGENMYGASFKEKEDWAYDTYAQGMIDGLKQFPGRKMTFVHRQHYAGALDIAEKFKPVIDHPDIEFIYSFKYAKAHVYSSTEQPYHEGFVKDIQGKGDLKTIWTLRNDDIYYFRWGAPDYVREFLKNIPYDVSRGYYYGSDQYIWGREFLDKYPSNPRQIEVSKHWYHWMIWGRLGYDPDMGNDRFQAILKSAFPKIKAVKLFDAWQKASMVYPLTTGFHWGSLDFQWYIEGCQSRDLINRTPYRYNDINDFITLPPHPRSGNISIPKFVDAVNEDKELEGRTPYEVADALKENAKFALSTMENIKIGEDQELMKVLNDIRSMAYMGLFYGYKIQAATDLQFFRKRGNLIDRENAIKNLKTSIKYFKKYAANSMQISHNPLWTNRVGIVDWKKTLVWAMHDLKIIGADLSFEADPKLSGELIVEAENAAMDHGNVHKSIDGFSGDGYIRDARNVQFTFDVPESGNYKVKFRYNINWRHGIEKEVTINGKQAEPMYFWNTGKTSNWTVDENVYHLEKGKNTIGIDWIHRFNLDQVALEKTDAIF